MFLDHWSLICSRHKEETLTFLTVKTAAVRCGAKPAELLRVPLCGRAGMAGCDAVRNVFARLGLPYRILSEDAGGALALFYHPTRLNEAFDLSGRKVAVFGTGDSVGFADTFANALGILADKAVERGATLVGQVPAVGYAAVESLAVRDGNFVGLALDDTNEAEQTPDRIAAWAKVLQAAI